MQRILFVSVAAGLAAAGLWTLVRNLRSRTSLDRDLGSVSDAWLNDPRSNIHRSEP